MFFKKRKELLKSEEANKTKFKDVEFEKNDTLALIIAALITLLPVVLLMMGAFSFIIWLLFLR